MKKRFIYLLVGVAWIFSHAQAQITASEIEESEKMLSYVHVPMFHKARLLIENKQYSEALAKVDTLYRIYPYIPAVSYMAGVCWSQSDAHKKNAVAPFVILLGEPQRFPDLYFWVATAYEKNDSVRSAKEWYQKFIDQENHPEVDLKALKETAARKIDNLKMASQMKSFVSIAEITNIGSPINTNDDEYVPLLPSDESFMIFTYRGKKSKGGKQNLSKNSYLSPTKKEESMYFEDVFISYRLNDTLWDEPKPIKSINTSLHDAAVTLSSDGTLLFVYKNLGNGNGDLYLSKLVGSNWTVPVSQQGLNSDKWDGSAAFFPGNSKIIFASERKGGYGGKDLYTAEKIGENKWGNITNMGPLINSSYDEDAPFITADGQALFFASNGKLSTGGYDILRSDINEQGWSKPYNIGQPVNTINDDKFYMVTGNGKHGYYSTYKEGGMGLHDIYRISLGMIGKPVKLVEVAGNVTMNNKPIEALIEITSTTNNRFKKQSYLSNSSTGKFLVNLPSGEEYAIKVQYKELEPIQKNISTVMVDSFVQLALFADFFTKDYKEKLQQKQDSLMSKLKSNDEEIIISEFQKRYGEKVTDSLYYKIQIGAFQFIENFNYNKTMHLGKIIRNVYLDGITRFTIGNYTTFNEAEKTLRDVRNNAVSDAFIMVQYKNKFYQLKDLLRNNFFTE